MKPRRIAVCCALPAILLAGGCGTVYNTVGWLPSEGGRRAYGGVRADAGEVERIALSPAPSETARDRFRIASLLALDLPFSLVGDTLTLPYILWLGCSPTPRAPQEQPAPPAQPPDSPGGK